METVPPTRGADPARLLDRVQELSEQVDRLSDVRARTLAQDLVSAVIAMYGDGLERILAVVRDSREAGANILDQLSQDGAVASLLLIHDLYPVELRDRVIEALDTVRPYMESHGGNVELVELTDDGVAKLRLEGSCNGCAASRATLELAIKQALDEHAPDLSGLEVEGVSASPAGPDGVPPANALPMANAMAKAPVPAFEMAEGSEPAFELPVINAEPEPAARWVALDESVRPSPEGLREVQLEGSPVLFADVGGALLAYESRCAACGEPLGSGRLDGGTLRCPSCEVEFDLPRAGRAVGGEPLQLRPVPLLEAGGLRVAV